MPFINNLAYEASAGSGKTFMLVVRYLSLLFQGADASKILTLTFTNKAAREMSERIVETLEELPNRSELGEIATECGVSESEILLHRKKILGEFLNANTKIMTIDSFFTQILRKFSLYASLMPDFTTASQQHDIKLMNRFLTEVSASNRRNTLIELSIESQKRVSDIFKLLDEFYLKKEEFPHLLFTKKSTQPCEDMAMEALHNLQNMIRSCKDASKSLLNAVDIKDFTQLRAKTWVYKESLNYWVFKKCFTPEMDSELNAIQKALKEFDNIKEENFFYALNELVDVYKKAKKALYIDESELSFSDVTLLVYEILHRLNDSEFLYFRLDATIEHILLDEFQDTSILQYAILKPLIEEITSGEGVCDGGSFFFVGDVKQSIYRFRGGVSALFGEVAHENATEVKKLLTNYRSQKEVIEFVNTTFRNKIQNYTPQLTREEADGGYVQIITNDMLLDEVVSQVQRFLSLGVDLNDIAILCATNGDGQEIKNSLEEAGIEVVTETTTKLINQKSVQALLEYLKYLYFHEDIYRHNFFALIGRPVEPIASIDFNAVKLLDLIKRAIEKYELFHDDFHLIRFFNAIRSYPDIEALLFEYERLDMAAASADINGVRVLTIHKSKGLEYGHVIVLDRLKKAPPSRNTIIYNYEGISLHNLFVRTSKRELIDNDYAYALAKEKKLAREDTLNALYVAFTRAKENLIIIQKEKESAFEILDLHDGEFGKLSLQNRPKKVPKEQKKIPFEHLYYGTQSDLLALESEGEDDLIAINFGLALHYTLEMIESFEIDSLPNAMDMMRNKYGFALDEKEITEIEKRVKTLLKHKPFLTLIEGELFKEQALRFQNNLRYLDLLVKNKDGSYIIIDYKSSLNFQNKHMAQVRYYINAVKAITQEERVKGYLCYILEQGVTMTEV